MKTRSRALRLDFSRLYDSSKPLYNNISWFGWIHWTCSTRLCLEIRYYALFKITAFENDARALYNIHSELKPQNPANIRLKVHNSSWKPLHTVYICKSERFCADLRRDGLDINTILSLVILRRFIPALC